jgi:chloramphenicol-sensitive protein RarD
MTEARKGVLALVAACVVWGFSPLFYALLHYVPPLELLAHRVVWSAVIFGLLVASQGRLRAVLALIAGPTLLRVVAAAATVSLNWGLFIWSVQNGRTLEASMGYYIFPLVAVLLGFAAFGERLGPVRAGAVALAGSGVVVLTWGLGAPPWIALTLAISFGLYGLLKKQFAAGPVLSVTAEALVLTPVALIWLAGIHAGWWHEAGQVPGQGALFGTGLGDSLLLVVSGLVTAVPLVLFSYASRRISMATLGLTQFLNPTLQFFCAVVLLGEAFTRWHAAAFALIWAALAVYSAATLRQDRAARRRAASVSTSGTTAL